MDSTGISEFSCDGALYVIPVLGLVPPVLAKAKSKRWLGTFHYSPMAWALCPPSVQVPSLGINHWSRCSYLAVVLLYVS